MCLRFVFLLTTRLAAWLRFARREETWKTAEILILRHQLAVLQRQQPRRPNLDWADRALLATLLAVIPKTRRHGLHLLVTPDTILRWHRNIVLTPLDRQVRTRQDRPPGDPPRPKANLHRLPDQRVPPGRMTWTRFSARTRHGSRLLGAPITAPGAPVTPDG